MFFNGFGLLLLLVFHPGVDSKTININPSLGTDASTCGSLQSPCKNLKYVFESVCKTGDTILLHNDGDSAIQHVVDETVIISQNHLHINKVFAEAPNPVITTTNNDVGAMFTFAHSTSGDWNVTFESINFLGVNLLQSVNNSNVTLILKHCLVKNVAQSPFISSANDASMSIYLLDSRVDLVEYLIYSNHRNQQLKIFIENTVMLGGAVHVEQSQTILRLRNVTFDKSSNQTIYYKNLLRLKGNGWNETANVELDNILVTGSHSGSNLLSCEQCSLSVTNISFIDCDDIGGFYLHSVSGNMKQIHVKHSSFITNFLHIVNSRLSVEEVNAVEKNSFAVRFAIFQDKSIVNIGTLTVLDSTLSEWQQFLHINQSNVRINHLALKHCVIIKAAAIRLQHQGVLIVHYLEMLYNIFWQAILMFSEDDTGVVIISSGTIIGNAANSTFFGITNAKNFSMQNTLIKKNMNSHSNLFHITNSNTTFKSLTIAENEFHSCFLLESSNIHIDTVSERDNLAIAHGKAFFYETDKGGPYKIVIKNFWSSFTGHLRYEWKSYIMSISITNSHLQIKNVSIGATEMTFPRVHAVHLKFDTLNPNVAISLKLDCPANYNPEENSVLTRGDFTHTMDCEPCGRGEYSILGGSADITNVDNVGWDVETWKNPGRNFLGKNPPIVQQCKRCPPGGNCPNGIKSHGNYYGYKKTADTIKFIPCPDQYCCSSQGQSCTNYTSCNYNRQGVLCGRCAPDYYESYFVPKCIPKSECTDKSQRLFWFLFLVTSFIFTFAICASKDLVTVLGCVMTFLKIIMNKILFKYGSTLKINIIKQVDDGTPIRQPSFIYNNKIIINECLSQRPPERKFIFSAVIQILLSFFQMVSLITISSKSSSNETLTLIENIFNLQPTIEETEKICPFVSMTVIWKHFIKNFLFIIAMLSFVLVFGILVALFRVCKLHKKLCKCNTLRTSEHLQDMRNMTFLERLISGYVKILMFGYKNISLFTLMSLNCVNINGSSVLYISGDTKCFQQWQWAVLALLVVWVIPFPAVMMLLYGMLKRRTIGRKSFVFCLLFPIFTPLFLYNKKWGKSHCSFDEERGLRHLLYDTFEEPYRVTSLKGESKKTMYWWQAWRLYERFLIAAMVTFIVDPLLRICAITPVMVLLLLLHFHMKPYKTHMTLLTWLDISSYACLLFYVVDNMFRSFAYTFDLPVEYPIDVAMEMLKHLEVVFTPITVLVLFIIFQIGKAILDFINDSSSKKGN